MAFSRIKNYLCQQRLFFSVYMVGSIVCIITFAYFLGNGVTYKVNAARNEASYRTFNIAFNYSQPVNSELLDKLTDKVDTIRLESILDSKEISLPQPEMITKHYEAYSIYAYYPELPKLNLKRNLAEEFLSGMVVIPTDFLKSGTKISEITIGSNAYRVLSESVNDDSFIISCDDFFRAWKADRIQLLTKKVLGANDRKQFSEKLQNLFPDATIDGPSDAIKEGINHSATNIIYLSIMFLICLSTFSLLMQYMIEQNIKEIITYSIVGASPKQIAGLLMLDNLLISGMSVCLAIIIHMALYNSVFVLINIYENIKYTFADYILLAVLVIALSEVSMIPTTYKLFRRSTMQNINDTR